MTTPGKPLSLRAYARHRGCSAEAVRKAIRTGRLEHSLVMVDGKPKIANPELADQEWTQRTRTSVKTTTSASVGTQPPDATDEDDMSYDDARRRKEIELWRCAEIKREKDRLDLAERTGELVKAEEVRAAVLERFTSVRTKLLALPTRIAQRLPGITQKDVDLIDDLVRESLTELADEG